MNSVDLEVQDLRRRHRQRFAIAVLISAAWFLLFEFVFSPYLAYPLRLLSTEIATIGLRVIGIPVQMQGLAILADGVVFEIIEDCSGAATIQVLTATAILLLALFPRLRLFFRMTLLLVAIPGSLLINSFRIIVLVCSGYVGSQPLRPDDLLHKVIGVVCYCLGTYVFYRLCLYFDRSGESGGGGRLGGWFLVGCATLIFSPLIESTLLAVQAGGWNPGVVWNPVFLLLGIIAAWYRGFLPAHGVRWERITGNTMLLGGLLCALAGRSAQMPALQGGGLFWVVIGVILHEGGTRNILRMLPPIILLLCGLPRVGRVVMDLLTESIRFDWLMQNEALPMRAVVAGTVTLWCLVRWKSTRTVRQRGQDFPRPQYEFALCFFSLFAMVSLCMAMLPPAGVNAGVALERELLPYRLPGWVGSDITSVDGDGITSFLGEAGRRRRYFGPEGYCVDLLITYAGEGRENLHLPEYCFVAAGWKIAARTAGDVLGVGRLPEIQELRRGNDRIFMGYWYWSDGGIYRFYSMLIVGDLYNRLVGHTRETYVFRVAASNEGALACFLATLGQQGVFANASRLR